MDFLDNLENNLNALERHDEDSANRQPNRVRESERVKKIAAAPYAELLRSGPYTAELLKQATRAGHARRVKVHLAWLDTTLRLEARQRKLELRPTPKGVEAVFLENNQEVRTHPLDLASDPGALIQEWLGPVEAKAPVVPDHEDEFES